MSKNTYFIPAFEILQLLSGPSKPCTDDEGTHACVHYLQGLDELLPPRDVGDMDGCAESVQHPHFLKDVFAAGGANDEQLATLEKRITNTLHTQFNVMRTRRCCDLSQPTCDAVIVLDVASMSASSLLLNMAYILDI